jgi:hypothetical protein
MFKKTVTIKLTEKQKACLDPLWEKIGEASGTEFKRMTIGQFDLSKGTAYFTVVESGMATALIETATVFYKEEKDDL